MYGLGVVDNSFFFFFSLDVQVYIFITVKMFYKNKYSLGVMKHMSHLQGKAEL